MRAALGGDARAFRPLMARHRAMVYRLAWATTGDAEAARDVTQETFIAAFAALHRYDPARPLRWWLGRIALNKGRDWQRRQAVRRFWLGGPAETRPGETQHGEAGLDLVADAAPGPEHIAGARDELARTARAIAALPRTLREPIVLHGVEGMAQGDVAALLGVSQKAVETRIYRARKRLQQMLGQRD